MRHRGVLDRATLESLSPATVAECLGSRGSREQSRTAHASVWRLPSIRGLEVLLPLHPRLPGFTLRSAELVSTVAAAERGPLVDVLRDLQAVSR